MDAQSPRQKRVESVVLPLLVGVAILVAWHIAVSYSGTKVFPSPRAVWKGVGELLRSGTLVRYVRDSLGRVATGFGVAVLTGMPLGLALGLYPSLDAAVNPVVQVLRPISPLAWIPLAIVVFGITPAAAISLIFLGSVFPIVVSSMDAVRNVPPMYVQAGRNFGLSRSALFARVLFPAALPQMMTGLRISFGIAWIVLVAAEMIAVDSGLGYLIMDARNAGKRYDLVVAGMLIIGLLGLLLDAGLRSVERLRSVRWGFRAEE
jgi:NitT/TauT family transport system permease protein